MNDKLFPLQECRPRPSPEYCPYTLNPILLRVPQMYTMVDTLTKELTNEEEHGPIPVTIIITFYQLNSIAID